MVDHVTAVCRAPYFHLRQIRLITISVDAAKTIVQSFITCHLEYCNALFSSITDSLFRRLQSVQNAAARLDWLPVRQRVDFKLALLVYKALHDATAAYLVDDCQRVSHAGDRPSAAPIGRHRHVLRSTTTAQHAARRPELRSRFFQSYFGVIGKTTRIK